LMALTLVQYPPPPQRDYVRYISRSGVPTQNVMAVVDFDMRFTYAFVGQPGSMHDTSVLFHTIEHDTTAFPHPPQGLFFCICCNLSPLCSYIFPCLSI
jgi:hypothetical protein